MQPIRSACRRFESGDISNQAAAWDIIKKQLAGSGGAASGDSQL
jgi:hypothetical protein